MILQEPEYFEKSYFLTFFINRVQVIIRNSVACILKATRHRLVCRTFSMFLKSCHHDSLPRSPIISIHYCSVSLHQMAATTKQPIDLKNDEFVGGQRCSYGYSHIHFVVACVEEVSSRKGRPIVHNRKGKKRTM